MHPLHHLSFGVADLALAGRCCDAALANGGRDTCHAAFVIDPAGHAIEAVCKAPG